MRVNKGRNGSRVESEPSRDENESYCRAVAGRGGEEESLLRTYVTPDRNYDQGGERQQ